MSTHALRAFASFLVLVLIFAACGDDDGPVDPGPGGGDAEATGTVDASGGTLTASDGSFALTIPAGALTMATAITVREIDPATLDFGTVARSFDFEPDDLDFAEDVTFRVDLPEALSRLRRRNFEAAAPIVALTDTEISGVPSIRDLVDYVAQIPSDASSPSSLAFDIQNLGDGLISIMVPGAPVGGGDTIPFTIVIGESTPDAITRGMVGSTTVFDLEISSPPNFAPSQTVATTFLAGAGELIAPTLADGDPLPFVTSGVDGQSGRNLSYHELDVSVDGGLTDGLTARLSYGVRHTYDADLTDYWDSEVPLGFAATFEQQLGTIDIPVEIEDEPEGFRPGVWSVGAAVDGLSFAASMDGWRYEDAIFVTTGAGTRVLDSDFVPLDGTYVDPGAYGVVIGAWRAELETGLPEGIAMFRHGNGYFGLTAWDYERDDFGFTQIDINAGNVTDINPFDGNPLSGGIVKVDERAGGLSRVDFYRFGGEFWNFDGSIDQFPDATGPAISAVRRSMGSALIATGGETSQLYLNEVGESPGASVLIGTLGDDVRQLRMSGEVAYASLFGSGTIRPIMWPVEGTPTILDPVSVGNGPVSFDLKVLPNDNRLLVSAGFNDDTLWRTEFTAMGTLVSNDSIDLPDGVEAPSTVRFVPGSDSYVAVNGFDTGNIAILDLDASQ